MRLSKVIYCSPKCRVAGLSKLFTVPCDTCGKQMVRNPSHTQTKSGMVFCSRKCRSVAVIDGKLVVGPHIHIEPPANISELVQQMPISAIAKSLGVSDGVVDRWCVKLGIEKRPRGYWIKKNRLCSSTAEQHIGNV